MPKPRKRWATVRGPNPGMDVTPDDGRRHGSRAAAYRYVRHDSVNYAGGSAYSHTDVWVDERDGRGWQLDKHVDHTRTRD